MGNSDYIYSLSSAGVELDADPVITSETPCHKSQCPKSISSVECQEMLHLCVLLAVYMYLYNSQERSLFSLKCISRERSTSSTRKWHYAPISCVARQPYILKTHPAIHARCSRIHKHIHIHVRTQGPTLNEYNSNKRPVVNVITIQIRTEEIQIFKLHK